MKKIGFILTGLLGVLLVLFFCAGCAFGDSSNKSDQMIIFEPSEDKKDITITMLGYKADTLNLLVIEETIKEFVAKNPGLNVTYEGIKGLPFWQALDKRAASGHLDDIFTADHDHIINFTAENKLADLAKVPGLEKYAPLVKAQFMRDDGKIWFVPTSVSVYGLYVNYDLLKKDRQPVPNDWNSFAAVCDYYAAKGIAPIIVNNYKSLRLLMGAKGLYDVYQSEDASQKIAAFNKDAAALAKQLVPGVEMLHEMIARKWIDCAEAKVTTQTNGDLKLFLKGDRPFMVTGSWASIRFDNMRPAFSYAVHPFPILADGSVATMDADICVAVNGASKHKDETLRFLAHFIEPSRLRRLNDSMSSLSPIDGESAPSIAAIRPLAQCISMGRSVIGADYRLDLPFNEALDKCGDFLLDGATTDEAVKLMTKLLQGKRQAPGK